MITLLANTFPIALSLAAPSLPEIVTLALVLAPAALLALVVAMAGTVNSVSSSARKPQNITLTSNANPMTETSAYRLAMPFTRRHAASLSLDARTSRPWDGRSSRKGSWFTLIAAESPLNIQKLTLVGTVNLYFECRK
jgi:hypothetical protein